MSAWLCTRTHVAAIVRWIEDNDRGAIDWAGFGAALPEGLATMLHQENVRSIAARYPDSFREFVRGAEFSYTDIRRAPKLSPVEMLKAIQCFEYQSCEHDEWESSNAARFLRHAQAAAIAKLPGYDTAPWGIDDP
jgi:hypothetical protein